MDLLYNNKIPDLIALPVEEVLGLTFTLEFETTDLVGDRFEAFKVGCADVDCVNDKVGVDVAVVRVSVCRW